MVKYVQFSNVRFAHFFTVHSVLFLMYSFMIYIITSFDECRFLSLIYIIYIFIYSGMANKNTFFSILPINIKIPVAIRVSFLSTPTSFSCRNIYPISAWNSFQLILWNSMKYFTAIFFLLKNITTIYLPLHTYLYLYIFIPFSKKKHAVGKKSTSTFKIF